MYNPTNIHIILLSQQAVGFVSYNCNELNASPVAQGRVLDSGTMKNTTFAENSAWLCFYKLF